MATRTLFDWSTGAYGGGARPRSGGPVVTGRLEQPYLTQGQPTFEQIVFRVPGIDKRFEVEGPSGFDPLSDPYGYNRSTPAQFAEQGRESAAEFFDPNIGWAYPHQQKLIDLAGNQLDYSFDRGFSVPTSVMDKLLPQIGKERGTWKDFAKDAFTAAKLVSTLGGSSAMDFTDILSGASDFFGGGGNLADIATTVGDLGLQAYDYGFDAVPELLGGAGGFADYAQYVPEIASIAQSSTMPTGGGGGGVLDILRKYGLMPTKTSSLFNVGSGLYGMYRSNEMRKLAEEAMRSDNPFGPYRAQYAQMLQQLYANPKRITKMPGYEAGLDAVTRKMASQGYLGSGNMMLALQKYGGDFFSAEAARLAQLAGAQFSPNSGATLQGQQYSNDLASKALASIGYGLRGFEDIFGTA